MISQLMPSSVGKRGGEKERESKQRETESFF